jgi:hypothetical protein
MPSAKNARSKNDSNPRPQPWQVCLRLLARRLIVSIFEHGDFVLGITKPERAIEVGVALPCLH